jgi:error-prone DNA polymerase
MRWSAKTLVIVLLASPQQDPLSTGRGAVMSFANPPMSWGELERTLSGRANHHAGHGSDEGAVRGDGGDSPAWTRHRDGYRAPADLAGRGVGAELGERVPYAELHSHSNFSFLDGASHPETLAEEAARLGLDALALTDHDGVYGVVRFAEAARELGLRTCSVLS